MADHPVDGHLDGFTSRTVTADGTTRTVHEVGEGPGVLLMHEIPGIMPTTVALARRIADAGFTVAVPDLIGDAGRPLSVGYAAASMARLCISREFRAFALTADRPVVRWLRAAGRDLHQRAGGSGIGAIGMCMTGGFALALAVDAHVLAPVLSQPSLPVAITPAHARDLGLPDGDVDVVAQRCATEDLCLLGLRFRRDPLAPAARFTALADRFGDAFEAIELDDREWTRTRAALPAEQRPPSLTGRPHGVIGGDFLDGPPTRAAMDRVIAFLTQRLAA